MTLKIYHNGNDWVVAESPEDAEKVYGTWSGEPTDEDEAGEWEPIILTDNDPFVIVHDCLPDELNLEDLPEGATIKKAPRGTDVIAPVSAWISFNGRGYLCGMDW